MAAFTRKQYSGAARNTTTTTLLTNVGTTVDIAATTGWPSIAGIPFYVVINPSSIYEEKCLATISGSTLTLVRAQDDTTASEHPIGSVIYPVFTANDADEANELVSKLTTKGDLLTTDGTNLLRLGVGPNGYFLKASTSASAGVEWASIPTINSLNDIGDVTITSVEGGDFLTYNSSASAWVNETIHFLTVSDTPPNDEVEEGDLWYNSVELELYTYYSGAWVQMTDTSAGVQELYELVDVLIDDPLYGQTLVYNGTEWENGTVLTAQYLENARAISLSGDVSGSVAFDGSQNVSLVTTLISGNASTASALQSPRTISLSGDVSGSFSFDGSQNVSMVATIQPNSVALGTDTSGNYVSDITAGTGISVTHTPGEGSSPTIAIGQPVGTSASVTFANVTANLVGDVTGNSDTATSLETARIIELSGDVSGSASFDGTSNINLFTTVNTASVAITELGGVVITNPEEFQGLSYNGTNWVNSHIPLASYVRNAEATTLQSGEAVYLFGGNGDHASVKRADNTTEATSSKTIGLVGASIAPNQNGPVITRGYVDGINLSAYNVGEALWLGTNGQVTTTKPTAPTHMVFIGVVVRATNNGIAYVATQNGYELNELHDVKTNGKLDKDVLMWNSASMVWINDQINLGTDTVGSYVQNLVAGTGVTVTNNSGEGATPTIAIGQDVGTSASVTFANLIVSGDLTVSGTTTSINTTELTIEDNVVLLNSNATGAPTQDAGIEVERGSSANVSLRWNETSDKWEITTDGSNYEDIATTLDVSAVTISALSDIGDVSASAAVSGDYLKWNGTAWVNDSIDLGTDTTGSYVQSLVQGTGVTITNNSGESATPTIAIGQAVSTSSDVQFASIKFDRVIETATVSASAATSTVNLDYKTNSTLYYTSNATGNWTMNLRGDGSTTLNSLLAVNDVATMSFLVTNGGTAYYPTAFQIDGSSVTPKWQNGVTPTSGNTNSIDVYSFTVVKTSSAPAYTVFASQSKFA